jgi:hypothetical protein
MVGNLQLTTQVDPLNMMKNASKGMYEYVLERSLAK